MSNLKPLARKTDIVVQDLDNEILIYDLRENKAFTLNETSATIWQLSKGDKTISEIADILSAKFNSQINDEFVFLAIEQFHKENLVENFDEMHGLFSGFSRRAIIKRVGFATAVALPMLFSVIAPSSISAQSACAATPFPTGCPCTANPNCANFCCGFALVCVTTGLVAPGGNCRVNCECTSGSCPPIAGPNICA